MNRTPIRVILIFLSLCATIEVSQAEQTLRADMEAACRPAAPVKQTMLHWKRTCTNDCFLWRLTCSNGYSLDMQSNVHPATTDLQYMFYAWAPWSFALYLLPFLLYAGIATAGSRALLLFALNMLFLGYAAYAGWSFYEGVTGNPLGRVAELRHLLVFNPYVSGPIAFLFVLINLPAVWRGLDGFLYRHRAESGSLVIFAGDPIHAVTLSTALMPNLYEFADPAEIAAHYRRQTDHTRVLKEQLDAQTDFANSVILHHRAQNGPNSDH